MPEVNEHKRKNVQEKKSVCGSCTCCFSPRNKRAREQHTRKNNESLMVTPTIDPPFVDDLPEDLPPGTCISITGFIKPECSRFAVNFRPSKDPDSDIVAHINPRLAQRYVVRNHRIDGEWGDEETTSITKFELARNDDFELDIVLTDKEFLVAINGKHICAFVFRIPISKVKVLQVEGAVEVYDVRYRKLQVYPDPTPQNSPFTIPMGAGQHKVATQQLEMPLTAVLPRGFQQGWQLEIYGRVKILPYAFFINLQHGAQLWPHPIIPLHLNPRFSAKYGKHLFVRNAWIDGEWGREERSAGFQFSPGSHFNVAIRKNDDHFSVWVDGQLAGEFKFRGATDRIDTVYIHGDVVIQKLFVTEAVDNKYFNRSQGILVPTSE